jgi:hypothetical protein
MIKLLFSEITVSGSLAGDPGVDTVFSAEREDGG